MEFGGITKILFSKRMCQVSTCFDKTGDVYFAAANSIICVL